MRTPLLMLTALLLLPVAARGQSAFEGDTLVSPLNSTDAFLMDMNGTVLQTWHGADRPASMPYLLDDGSIIRPCKDPAGAFQTGGTGGRIQIIDATDTVVWDYYFSTTDYQQHHDIQPLPNGNVLLIAWERKTAQEAQAAGRLNISTDMWPTLIVEVEPVGSAGGNIVWEWHLWDHMVQDVDPAKPNYGVISEHPGLMDLNYGTVGGGQGGDWIHVNAIDYHEEFDQIIFGSRVTNEFYIIDHSTTTAQAAGHGGDFLYRWGNPQVYGCGAPTDQYFSVLHGVNWIDPGLPGEGNILAFNNGDRPGTANDQSSADEIVPPVDALGNYALDPGAAYEPVAPTWTYTAPGFYAGPTQCGAYRLPNGNTLLCAASDGDLFEVTTSGTIVWTYDHPAAIARAQRYWDEAPACPENLDGLNGVGQGDLNMVLNRWGDPDCLPPGSAYPCAEDLDTLNGVGQGDLNLVLNRWGDPDCE